MRAAVVALVLLPSLAGCLVEPPSLEGAVPRAPGAEAPEGIDAANLTAENASFPLPTWRRGFAWRWNLDAAGESGSSQTWVVVEDQGDAYTLAATDPHEAAVQAFFGRTMPGRVHRQYLSGFEQGAPTHYLDFPLTQNKTWVLRIRDEDFLVKANFTPQLDGRGPGFAVEGSSPSGARVSLGYAPSVQWMTRFQIAGPDGRVAFTRALASFTQNYTGPYFTASSEDLFEARRAAPPPPVPADTFTVPRAPTLLRAAATADGTGAVDIRVLDPAGLPVFNFTGSGAPFAAGAVQDMPPSPGPWRATWAMTGSVNATLRVAGIDIAAGTLEP